MKPFLWLFNALCETARKAPKMFGWLCPNGVEDHNASIKRSSDARHDLAGDQQVLKSTIEHEAISLAKHRKEYYEFLSRDDHHSTPDIQPRSNGTSL